MVYRAWDRTLNRTCAIKIPHCKSEGARLLREAKMAASLRGPHVVRIFDTGLLSDGTPYLVMEYLEGNSLSFHLREFGPVSVERAITWGQQICTALQEAHTEGLIHRDIKPSNLFLTKAPDGATSVTLLDFGLARPWLRTAGDSTVTQDGGILGSPAYMSPEQLRGQDIGPLSDIWSVGIVLFEMVSGKKPFERETPADMLTAIISEPPLPLETAISGVPTAFVTLVERCLRKRIEDRYCSIEELGHALRELGSDQPSSLRSWEDDTTRSSTHLLAYSTSGNSSPQRRAVPRAMLTAALVGLGIILSSAAWLWLSMDSDAQNRTSTLHSPPRSLDRDPSASPTHVLPSAVEAPPHQAPAPPSPTLPHDFQPSTAAHEPSLQTPSPRRAGSAPPRSDTPKRSVADAPQPGEASTSRIFIEPDF